ncbi:MAG: helicase-related protein [Planctomycetota bacterium]|nr:helicase-related protein [Planctomycetota bacterium]
MLESFRDGISFGKLSRAWTNSEQPLQWGGFWGSSKALTSFELSRESEVPLLVIVPDSAAMDLALEDLSTFGAGAVPFPAREGKLGADAEVLRERFHALELVARKGFSGILVAPITALIQPVPSADDPTAILELAEGITLDPEDFLRTIVQSGFERVPAITEPGQVAMRGDIVDFYPPALGEPLRLEFFDDELESIRVFDLGSQRTRHILHRVRVPLGSELPEVASPKDVLPFERMPTGTRVIYWEPTLIEEAAQRLRLRGGQWSATLQKNQTLIHNSPSLGLAALPGKDGTLDILSVEEYCRGVADGACLLADRAADGERVVVFCATEAESSRLKHILEDQKKNPDSIDIRQGGLERGFRVPEARLTVLHHRELIPGHGQHRPKARHNRKETTPIDSILSLKNGDIVVHAVHGVARFFGLDTGTSSPESGAASNEGVQDVIVLEFDGGSTLHVPASRVDLIERYIGAGGSDPQLDRLGSGSFERRREKVANAVEDMAADLLDIQASRHSTPGTPFSPIPEQAEFDGSFPWEDTPDQAQGTREILDDLALPKSMDRLLCGDVGYGKTELAARAAFRVLYEGWQVAVLVPTTVLAEQHTRTLRERFADWPVRIEQLSRIVPPRKRKEIIDGVNYGTVDLVVGTHRILSRDIKFAKLGLVIVDEEQRFGVKAKDLLKKKRSSVDVLTLSATPIPRTLHMAMAGIRDITALSTAPAGRQEVHTEIRYADESDLIQEAIRRELSRGGQVFFVHNRVHSLERVAASLKQLVPEANIVTGHGQMEPRELEKAMIAFVRGEADILCSTTIIESGLDIPNANTIFIDDAQNFGLADLHQLRGRVGRATHRGWCYLLIPRGKPMARDSRRRLKAVEELRYLGAGFQIAMRDLEIRGAGNLLGKEQSGHINAVGYETYRRLLSQAVSRIKRNQKHTKKKPAVSPVANISVGVSAALSPSFIPDEESRLEILRLFDKAKTPEQMLDSLSGVQDRFGPPPAEVQHLAQIFFLKHRLGEMGLDSIHRVDDRLICRVRDMKNLERSLRGQDVLLRIITPRQAHWVLPDPSATPEEVLAHLFKTAAACSPRKKRRKSASRS